MPPLPLGQGGEGKDEGVRLNGLMTGRMKCRKTPHLTSPLQKGRGMATASKERASNFTRPLAILNRPR